MQASTDAMLASMGDLTLIEIYNYGSGGGSNTQAKMCIRDSGGAEELLGYHIIDDTDIPGTEVITFRKEAADVYKRQGPPPAAACKPQKSALHSAADTGRKRAASRQGTK